MLETDSKDYDILKKAAADTSAEGLFCEIGVRRGGGLAFMMEADKAKDRVYIGVDPYGNIDYLDTDTITTKLDYDNTMRDQAMLDLYDYSIKVKKNLLMFILEDSEFFAKFSDGIPVYNENKMLLNKYALVHFDGPHETKALVEEIDFFCDRAADTCYFVFDDIENYKHDEIETYIETFGFHLIEKGERKASYRRIKKPSIFGQVINLKERRDRLEVITDTISKLNVNFVVQRAFDKDDAKQFHEQKMFYYDTKWEDPLLKRKLTWGEMGCFLSQYSCWERVADSGIPSIIFEDDVQITNNFGLEKFTKEVESFLSRTGEIFYLSHYNVGENGKKYPYWACAYILKPSGAEKLLNTDIKHNVIPTDEYLPLMCGYEPFNDSVSLHDHYKRLSKYEKLRVNYAKEQLFAPAKREILGSDTENSLQVG